MNDDKRAMNDKHSIAPQQEDRKQNIPADVPEDPTPAQPATEQQLQQAEEKIEERMSAFERSMLRLTRAAIFISVITGLIFAGQLYEMIAGGTQTDKLVDYAGRQAGAANRISVAADDFSKTADRVRVAAVDMVTQEQRVADNAKLAMDASNQQSKAALDASISAFRIDERAWIELEPITAIPISSADDKFPAGFSCSIYPKNVGRTVATNISVKAAQTLKTGEFLPEEMQSFQRMLLTAKSYTVNIGPEKTTQSVSDRFPSNPVPKVLAPNTISSAPFRVGCQATKDYASGEHAYTFVVGRIDYCDAFNVRHWKTFCFYVANARGDVWNCHEGNDEDRNPEQPTPQTACGEPN